MRSSDLGTKLDISAALAKACPRVHTALSSHDWYMVPLSLAEAKVLTEDLVTQGFLFRKIYTGKGVRPYFKFPYEAGMWQLDAGDCDEGLLIDFTDASLDDNNVLVGGIAKIGAKTAEIQL